MKIYSHSTKKCIIHLYLTFKDIQHVEYIYIQQTNDYLTSKAYITREICSTFYIFASYKCI